MKRAWMIALLTVGLTLPAMGAEPKAAVDAEEDRIDRRIEGLAAELKLSKSQQDDLRKVFEGALVKSQEFRKEFNEKRKKLQAETEAKVTALLKPDQKTKYLELRSERKEGSRLMQDMRGGGNGKTVE